MVRLTLATIDDFDFFYQVKANADNLLWTGYLAVPIRQNLYSWFMGQIVQQEFPMSRKIFVISEVNENDIVSKTGYIYLDPIDNQIAKISIAVLESFSGRKIGRTALEQLFKIAYNKGFH